MKISLRLCFLILINQRFVLIGIIYDERLQIIIRISISDLEIILNIV
jgi:hypothetical protein